MKYFLVAILAAMAFSACQKEDQPLVIIDPLEPHLLATDTIESGEKWGLQIGTPAEDLYRKLQQLEFARPIEYAGVVGNVFTGISGLENKIPLYQSVFLDETKGTSSGIQISFSAGKVSAIYTNEGKAMNRWPSGTVSGAAVVKGDPVEKVYQKLSNISGMAAYARKFERVSIFSKDLKTEYDTNMSSSPQWYFVASVEEKKYYEIFLNLKDGRLSTISYRFYQAP